MKASFEEGDHVRGAGEGGLGDRDQGKELAIGREHPNLMQHKQFPLMRLLKSPKKKPGRKPKQKLVISEVTQDEISKDSGEDFEMRKISLVIPMKTSSRNQVRDFSI